MIKGDPGVNEARSSGRTTATEAPAPCYGGTLLSIALALSLAACAPAPTTSESLERARAAVQSAEVDVNVSLYAAPDLQHAKHALQLADAAVAEHDMDTANQHAHLTTQSAKLAQLYGVAKADEARLADGQAARGLVMTFADVLFDAGHTELKPGARRNLNLLVQLLNAYHSQCLEIDGLTDSVGSDWRNDPIRRPRNAWAPVACRALP